MKYVCILYNANCSIKHPFYFIHTQFIQYKVYFHILYNPGYFCPPGTGPYTVNPCPAGTYSNTPG